MVPSVIPMGIPDLDNYQDSLSNDSRLCQFDSLNELAQTHSNHPAPAYQVLRLQASRLVYRSSEVSSFIVHS